LLDYLLNLCYYLENLLTFAKTATKKHNYKKVHLFIVEV
jgi:hypothetical protein